jgi:hypothetical protein
MKPYKPQFDANTDPRVSSWRADKRHKNAAEDKLVNSARSSRDVGKKLDENQREYDVRDAMRDNMSVADLEESAARGYPLEVSGDAMSRFKAGKPGKYHKE